MSNPGNSPINILIIDDHVLFREGLVSLFDAIPDFHVVGQAGTVREGIEKAFHFKPNIILMDFSLPDGTGLDATQVILDELPDCKIIFLTVYETNENLLEAIRLGAKGYLLKNVSGSSLLSSLRALSEGEIAMSRKMMTRVVEASRIAPASPTPDFLDKLSPREIDVLLELQNGASNNQIAQKLFISENTVKHHVHSILEKLGVENRHLAGQAALKVGLKKNKSVSGKE